MSGHVDQEVLPVGNGGEVQQQATGKKDIMTTDQGCPISDNQNTLRSGSRGPALLEDFVFREKMFHFDHERIPERVVHARGYGAHGYFQNYESLSDITCADLFQRAGEQTPVFVRFSTVVGNKGSPDVPRDVRGFATKFYTKKGNWDLVGNNIPVFFIQDAMKFPDLVHAAKQEPDRDFPQAATAHDNFWDFISLMPESMHMIMWAMSDRAIPRSFRFMEGFGVHTFRFVNAEGKSTFVKFHWKPKLGLQSVVWNEALKINGTDPDFHRRDLWDSIIAGKFPEWELGVQLFDESFAQAFTEKYGFDILDSTKIIPEEEIPVRKIGVLVLNRLVDNFFQETEQVAFCTQNIVPGIDFTDDPLLQGRNFSYLDTQLKRLGTVNFTSLPINAPKCPFANFHQDGHMNFRNPKGRINYEPNSYYESKNDSNNPRPTSEGFRSTVQVAQGMKGRSRSETFADHYSQARQFFISQTELEQGHIRDALIFELSAVENTNVHRRMVGHLLNIDEELAAGVARGLGMKDLPSAAKAAKPTLRNLPASAALSIMRNGPQTFTGRKLGILVSEGADADLVNALKKAFEKQSNCVQIVAERISGVHLSDGALFPVDKSIESGSSVLFDAVVVLFAPEGAASLQSRFRTKDFVSDAFSHFKFIGFNTAAESFLAKAGVEFDAGCIPLNGAGDVGSFLQALSPLRYWPREQKVEGKGTLAEPTAPETVAAKESASAQDTHMTDSAGEAESAEGTVFFHEDTSKKSK